MAVKIPFYSHIEGLRAVAVMLVVLHHIGLLDNGFLGVDVFFVISGFIITSLLARELIESSRIDFQHFYVRRICRILPLALFVIASSVIASWILNGGLEAQQSAEAGIWATFFLANYYFYTEAIDYFRNPDPSVLQHYWSLAVEEQFYVVWPILLFLFFLATGKKLQRKITLFVFIPVLISFALALIWNSSSSPTAYFNTLSRFWELGLGALLALVISRSKTLPVNRHLTTPALLGLLVISLIPLDGVNPILLIAASVFLTLVLIQSSIALQHAILSHPILVRIGKRSYGWYLWH